MRHNRFKIFALVTAIALLVAAVQAIAMGQSNQAQSNQTQSNQAQSKTVAPSIVSVLEKSGLSYTKVSDGVWEIPATGKNLKAFAIRIASADDTLLVIVKMVDRKGVNLKGELLVKLLELNNHFDTVKLALDENMLYARIDLHVRLVDDEELKYLVGQIANVVDETYPHVKPFLTDAK